MRERGVGRRTPRRRTDLPITGIGVLWTGFKDPTALRRRWVEDGWLGVEHGRRAVECSGSFAGDVSYKEWPQGVSKGAVYEIGIALLPEHRGQGVGTTAHRLLVQYLFNTTPAHRLQAYTEVENIAEQRALERSASSVRASCVRPTTGPARGATASCTRCYATDRDLIQTGTPSVW